MTSIGSLFSGIGGLELGLERAGLGPVRWQVEKEAYCRAVLQRHWPDARRFDDVRTVGGAELERVRIICGGFPCQDLSIATRSTDGIDGERSGLWFEFARIIGDVRPQFVVVENVAGLLIRGMGDVLGSLSTLGYDAEWSVISACAVGAPHMRRRVLILAYADGVYGWPRVRGDSRSAGPLQHRNDVKNARADYRARLAHPSALYRGAHGIPHGLDRNRALGNAVVPGVAELVGRYLVRLIGADDGTGGC